MDHWEETKSELGVSRLITVANRSRMLEPNFMEYDYAVSVAERFSAEFTKLDRNRTRDLPVAHLNWVACIALTDRFSDGCSMHWEVIPSLRESHKGVCLVTFSTIADMEFFTCTEAINSLRSRRPPIWSWKEI